MVSEEEKEIQSPQHNPLNIYEVEKDRLLSEKKVISYVRLMVTSNT